jgi:hypothetical protein
MGYMQIVTMLINFGYSALEAHKAATEQTKAQSEIPSLVDPQMQGYLDDVNRQRKSFNTGTAFSQQLNDLKSSEALTDKGILKAAGGGTGAAISGLSRVHMGTGKMFGDIAQQGIQETNYLDSLYGKTLGDMSQRSLSIQMMKYNQDYTASMDLNKKSNANILAGGNLLSTMLDSKANGGTGNAYDNAVENGVDPITGLGF